MPIFTLRRLQNMLDTIEPLLNDNQAKDLVSRLKKKEPGPVLAAEIELGLLWALSQVTEIQTHFELPTTGRRPEAFCPKLFPSAPAFIEVTAVSDDTFSDRDKMELTADKISHFSNGIRKGASKNLYFHFAEKIQYTTGQFERLRRVSSSFELSSELKHTLTAWLEHPSWPSPKSIRLTDDQIDVVISWKDYVHPEGRTFCSMPAIPYDIEANPVFTALNRKREQLSGVPDDALKVIFLGDAGCSTLRDLRPINQGTHAISGEQIISHFLRKSSVDIVVVFSAQRANIYNPINSPLTWQMSCYDKRDSWSEHEYVNIEKLKRVMPMPNYEAYQARSLQRQGRFNPQSQGQYLGTFMHVRDVRSMNTEIKFSARLFHEFIAGRIDAEHFRRLNGALELFEHQLKQGRTLKAARIEPAGLDEDDDYLVFEFAPDAAARPLRNPKQPSPG